MCAAIGKELALQKNYLSGETLETIYFGGGTPSLLDEQELTGIFNNIQEHYTVTENPECTLEGNPDDLNPSILTMLRNLGVNRLSIGIQSFNNEILKSLNRAHTKQQAEKCIADARNAGFDNISCDLIYAIPGLSNQEWEHSIHQLLTLNPEHISAYSLTIEEKTVFGNWQKKGKLQPVEDDLAAQQLELLVDVLADHGYDQYEVSNFAKSNFLAVHNTNYWRQEKYLGVGPSAHSFNGISRQFNVSNNTRYLSAISSGEIPATIEPLSKADRINEYLLTTLRTKWGSDLNWLQQEFNFDLYKENSKYIEELLESGLAIIQHHFLILTRKGMMVGDKIASDLFVIQPEQ